MIEVIKGKREVERQENKKQNGTNINSNDYNIHIITVNQQE